MIVVAYHAAFTTLVGRLRDRFDFPLIATGLVVKSAASVSKSKIITVLATLTTLKSARYAELKAMYASNLTVNEHECSEWSFLTESNTITRAIIAEEILPSITVGSDVVVLSRTHNRWIEPEIQEIVGKNVMALQPEQAPVAQLTRVILRFA